MADHSDEETTELEKATEALELDTDWHAWFVDDRSTCEPSDILLPCCQSEAEDGRSTIAAAMEMPLSLKQEPHRIGFFDLPPELRVKIYQYAIEGCCRSSSRLAYLSFTCQNCRYNALHYTPCVDKPRSIWGPSNKYKAPEQMRSLSLLNAFATVSKQFSSEARAEWLTSWDIWVHDDAVPTISSTANGICDDFPKLKAFLRRMGDETKLVRHVVVMKFAVPPSKVPTREQLEHALGGCDNFHNAFGLDIDFYDECGYSYCGFKTVVSCANVKGTLMVIGTKRESHCFQKLGMEICYECRRREIELR